jgi:hypothetical protein
MREVGPSTSLPPPSAWVACGWSAPTATDACALCLQVTARSAAGAVFGFDIGLNPRARNTVHIDQ